MKKENSTIKHIQSENCYLRALEVEDIDVTYDWENDASLWEFGTTNIPLSRQAIRDYVHSNMGTYLFTKNQIRFMICLKKNDEPIGTIDLFDYQPIHLRASVGIFIQSRHQKQGFAREALECVCKYAAEHLQVHQLYAEVSSLNEKSLQLFKKEGFEECGCKKEWLRKQKIWEDVICFQKIF